MPAHRDRLFPSLVNHFDHQFEVEDDHATQLVKGIVGTYVRTKLYHKGKHDTKEAQGSSVRHKLTKLILFNNQ
jgi:hypothetical protein